MTPSGSGKHYFLQSNLILEASVILPLMGRYYPLKYQRNIPIEMSIFPED
jgi:hypothetical protein